MCSFSNPTLAPHITKKLGPFQFFIADELDPPISKRRAWARFNLFPNINFYSLVNVYDNPTRVLIVFWGSGSVQTPRSSPQSKKLIFVLKFANEVTSSVVCVGVKKFSSADRMLTLLTSADGFSHGHMTA